MFPTCPPPYVPLNQTRTNEPVVVKANVTALGREIVEVVLKFRKQGGQWFNTTMSYNETENLWVQIIPGQNENCTVEFFMDIYDQWGYLVRSDNYSFTVKLLPKGDVNGDGVTNMKDIALCIVHFNERSMELALMNFNKHE